jgi:hypothetical protein
MMKASKIMWNIYGNARNAFPNIQDIEIINTFHDRVSDIKVVEEITMKKPRMMAGLLAVTDICIEASKAQARLLESCGQGLMKKKQDDQEVNTTDQIDCKYRGDRGYHKNCQQQSSDQKEKRSFHHLDDAEKWCEIHQTSGHDLKECKTLMYHKMMPPAAAQVAQEP